MPVFLQLGPTLLAAALTACTSTAPDPPVGADVGPAQQAAPTPPDIVIVLIDTLRADHLGLYGYPRPTSPNIDAWAEKGVVFDRAYAHSGWTLASVTSLLTGTLPHQHRVGRHPMDARCYGRLPDSAVTLPERLRGAGYATGAFINNTFLAPEFGLQQGFGNWDWQGSSEYDTRSADDTVTAALSWLERQDKPAFMVVHFMEPHVLYRPPADLLGTFSDATPVPADEEITGEVVISWQTYQSKPTPAQAARTIALYDEEILGVDRAAGRLFDALAARPRADRTMTVMTSDHGEEFWDHGGFEHGQSLLSELTRVPLAVVGPGVSPGRVRTLVGHTDLHRSLLRTAGLPAESGGDALALAELGAYAGPRTVISENTLYGPPRVSIVGDELRLDVRQDNMTMTVWELDARAAEAGRLAQPDTDPRVPALQQALMAARGDLAPAKTVAGAEDGCGAQIPDPKVFAQLEALGYLDARPDVPVDQLPSDSPAPSGPGGSGSGAPGSE